MDTKIFESWNSRVMVDTKCAWIQTDKGKKNHSDIHPYPELIVTIQYHKRMSQYMMN